VATIAEMYALALQYHQAGDLHQAEQLYHQVLQVHPGHAEAHHWRGVLANQMGRHDQAVVSIRHALRLKPDYAEAHNNLGSVLQSQGLLAEAVTCYRQAVQLNANLAEAHTNLGSVLHSQGQLAEAAACYRQALRLNPNLAEVHYNLGNTLQSLGSLDEAVTCNRQAVRLNPGFAAAHVNLGLALRELGRLDEALASFHQALRLNPNFAEAHYNLGSTMQCQGRLEEAVVCHRRALELKPDYAEAHVNLAIALRELGHDLEAITCCQRAWQLGPDNPAILGELTNQLQHACQWANLTELSRQLLETVAIHAVRGSAAGVDPFLFLALPTSTTADQQRQCARQWVEQRLKSVRSPKSEVRSQEIGNRKSEIGNRRSEIGHSRIKVGYFSADFHEHAIAYLIPELIEKHDREHFAVFGYSYGPDDGSPTRRRLVKAFDRFVDLKDVSFMDAARSIQADAIDILVDLKGYTGHARTQILALGPAPIQVNYLGYPGTMAAPFIDYILVDDFVVPPDQQPFFSEKLVYLPGCYQVNDSRREIAAHAPSRAECGLPEAGFVFCCFNNSYKITPEVFEVWMRLLNNVPGSVLWLLGVSPLVPVNLGREAAAQGVAPERLVFAPRLPLAEHLARHRLADLFLDTLPYNAHVTASDALWAGCPVLTMAGQTFPSRVAGSLLRTIGLPELITTSLQEYEELALRLARDGDLLNELRARLQANRKTSRLFDGGQFARSLEQAYVKMWEIYASGAEPRGFKVPTRD